MQATADRLNMQFRATDEYGLLNLLKDFELFKRGHGKRVSNIIYHEKDFEQPDFRVFDYRFVVGAGNNTRAIQLSVTATDFFSKPRTTNAVDK